MEFGAALARRRIARRDRHHRGACDDLARNNGVAAGAEQTFIDNVVGLRVLIKPRPDRIALKKDPDWVDGWSAEVESEWKSFADVVAGLHAMTNPLAAHFVDVHALISLNSASRVEAALHMVALHPCFAELFAAQVTADDGVWPAPDDWRAAYRPYGVRDGILHIPVKGMLLHDWPSRCAIAATLFSGPGS